MIVKNDFEKVLENEFDPVTAEIVRMRLENIVNEMGVTMIRTSGSPVLTEAVDFSTCLLDENGEHIAFAAYITFHTGASYVALQNLFKIFSRDEIHPGDAFICNDPHTAGNAHPPDVAVLMPMFYEDTLIGWGWAEAHLMDSGGMSAGGWAPGAYDCVAEALRIPPIKFIDRGTELKDIRRLITNNNRLPGLFWNDVRSLVAANKTCQRRLEEFISSIGLSEFKRYNEINKALAEKLFRERIRQLPNGVYESLDWVEHNGHVNELYPVKCKLTIKEDQMTFDFTGSAPQTNGFVNCAFGPTYGNVLTPIIQQLTYDIPFNAGITRPIEIIAPEGTIINPIPPAPVSWGHVEAGARVSKTVTEVLSKALASSSNETLRGRAQGQWHDCWPAGVFYGTDQYGNLTVFFNMDGGGAGGGAQSTSDGLDAGALMAQVSNGAPDVETNEISYPVLYLWKKVCSGSGGAGLNRGGQGIDFAWTLWGTEEGQQTCASAVWQVPARGAFGGYPGGASGYFITRNSNVDEILSSGNFPTESDLKGELELWPPKIQSQIFRKTDIFHQVEGGGGGYGDPLLRDIKQVEKDVIDGYITPKAAKNVYGVVVNEKTKELLVEETMALRTQIRNLRKGDSNHSKVILGNYQHVEVQNQINITPYASLGKIEAQDVLICQTCLAAIGPVINDWRDVLVKRTFEASERLGEFDTWIVKRESENVLLQEYSCPNCGHLHDVEVTVTGIEHSSSIKFG